MNTTTLIDFAVATFFTVGPLLPLIILTAIDGVSQGKGEEI